jgi:hypothetical protein
MKQIKTLEALKKAAKNKKGDLTDFYMLVAGGLARSSKRIIYHPSTKTFDVFNEIDDSFQENLTAKDLKEQTFIVDAIEAGTFYKY